jgi:AraC family transcriptional regulator
MDRIETKAEYFGFPVVRREINGLVLIEKIFPSDHQLPNHAHENLCICTILRGSMHEVGDGMDRIFTSMTSVFHPVGDSHRDVCGSGGAHIATLEFGEHWQQRLQTYSKWLSHPALHKNDPVTWLGLSIHREFQRFDAATPLAVEAQALELVSNIIRAEKPITEHHAPKWLKRVEEFLNENFESAFSMAKLSRIAGVHEVHLIRTFRKFHGTTVGSYLRRRRIQYACRLLQDSGFSLTEVGLRAGFYDQSHFNRIFRTLVGITPGQFRSLSQGN